MERQLLMLFFRSFAPTPNLQLVTPKSQLTAWLFLLILGELEIFGSCSTKFPLGTGQRVIPMSQSADGGPALEKGVWGAVAVAAVIVILRVFAKFKIKRFNVDDVLMIIAEV